MISGLATGRSVCVSCMDACCYYFIPIGTGVRESCGDGHRPPHEADLFDMNAKYAGVVGDREALAYVASLQKGR